jgi:hypothetical protein
MIIPKQRSSTSDGPKSKGFDLTLSPPMSRDLPREKSVFTSILEPARLQPLHSVTQVVEAQKSTTTKSKNTAKNRAPPSKRQTRASKRRKSTNEGSDLAEIQQLEKMARRVR